jgi:WD40 repeat protein
MNFPQLYLSLFYKRLSGSWDSTITLWDSRSNQTAANKIQTPGKVYSLSVTGNKVVVATSARHILIYDVRCVKIDIIHFDIASTFLFIQLTVSYFVQNS